MARHGTARVVGLGAGQGGERGVWGLVRCEDRDLVGWRSDGSGVLARLGGLVGWKSDGSGVLRGLGCLVG